MNINGIIRIIKQHSILHFDSEDLIKLINVLTRKDYQQYYKLEKIIDENDNKYIKYNIYLKLYSGRLVYFMQVKYHENAMQGCIEYEYGKNDTANRLLLHWLGDLLGNKYYINTRYEGE